MVSEQTSRFLRARLAQEHGDLRLPSVTAGLARGGALVWTGGYGSAGGAAPGPDVQYRCGSITKTFVAVLVMRLRDAVAELRIDAATGDSAIVMANTTAGFSPALAADLLGLHAEHEPADPPAPARDGTVPVHAMELAGAWYWGPAPFLVSLADGELEFQQAGPRARACRFRQASGGTWTGIDGYYAGEPITPVRNADGEIVALDIASHLFTRSPYDPRAPIPGGVDPQGWQPG